MTLATVAPSDRIPLIERRGIDFPLYAGVPVKVKSSGWVILLLSVAVGFVLLTAGASPTPSPLERGIRALAFLGLPLAALAIVAPGSIRSLFRPIGWRDIGVIVFCLFLGLVISAIVGAIVASTFGAVTNPAAEAMTTLSPTEIIAFFGATLIQLPGEELLALIPFLAILAFCHGRLGMSRRLAVIFAWVGSSIVFGAAHLPTYDWKWVQCLVVIGCARIGLTLSYVLTKNVTVSSIVHILNDWVLFGSGIVLAGLETTAG